MAVPTAAPQPATAATSAAPQPQPSVAFAAEPQQQVVAEHPVNVASWAANALQSLNIAEGTTGTGNPLSIPLDGSAKPVPEGHGLTLKRVMMDREPTPKKRDRSSLRHRNQLLEGREGTRQRRRWDNDHFKNVPNAQPPLASDYAVQPTHRVVHVPYHLARLWDDHQDNPHSNPNVSKPIKPKRNDHIGHIPRDVREAAKRNPTLKDWVRNVEEPVRWFVMNRRATLQAALSRRGSAAGGASVAGGSFSEISAAGSRPCTPDMGESGVLVGGKDMVASPGSMGDWGMISDTSDDELIQFRGRGRSRGKSMASIKSGTGGFSIAEARPFRPGTERKSLLSLTRDEEWEEVVATNSIHGGKKSRAGSNASTVIDGSGMLDLQSWKVVPGRSGKMNQGDQDGGVVLETEEEPAAMLFTPEQGREATFRRWIVHFVAVYYGLGSTSVDDGVSGGRYVFVGPAGGRKGKKSLKREVEGDVPGYLWERL